MITYTTYKRRFVTDFDFFGKILNGWYDLSFFLDFPEYRHPLVEKVEDGDVLCPKDSDGVRLLRLTHGFSPEELKAFESTIPPEFQVTEITEEEARTFVRSLGFAETEPGTFLVTDAYSILGTDYPARYLSI